MASNLLAVSTSPKPMRLGTKSCLECRRRKVRCIFTTPDATQCRQCLLHKIKCMPQGAPRHDLGDNRTIIRKQTWQPQFLTPPALDDFPRLKAVLDNIPSPASAATSQSGRPASVSPPDEAVERSRLLASMLESLLAEESDKLAQHGTQLSHRLATDYSEENAVFPSAPLLEYLRSTVIDVSPSGKDSSALSSTPSIAGCLNGHDLIWRHTILPLISNTRTLQGILELTKPYWSIWPLSHIFPNSVSEALTFIGQDLRDPDIAIPVHPGPAAKRLVWLALCLQQLPRTFHDAQHEALASHKPSELVQKLLNIATDLVHLSCASAKPHCVLASLEALVIAYKCYMNMGRPRQGWKCSRLGIENALLLGLHRPKKHVEQDPTTELRKKAIWTALWSHDRQMALFIGVPYAVPEHFLDVQVSTSAGDTMPRSSKEREALRRMMIISGHIVDRDQAPSASYAVTVRIEEEIEEVKSMIPSDVWLLKRTDLGDHPVGHPFWRRATVFFYHYVSHLLHLPFAVRGIREAKYQYSRSVAITSAEGMLLAFQNMPTGNDGLPVVCDWLDFAAFSGAMALVVDLLHVSSSSGVRKDQGAIFAHQRTTQEKQRLWALVMQFASDMRNKCELLDCRVSKQAAEVLENLYAAQKGAFNMPEKYEIVIPYFGKICIKRPQYRDGDSHSYTQQTPSSEPSTVNLQSESQQMILDRCMKDTGSSSSDSIQSTLVEFDLTTFGGARQPWFGNVDFELGEDWAAASRTFDLNEVNWNQVFEFGGDTISMECDLS